MVLLNKLNHLKYLIFKEMNGKNFKQTYYKQEFIL